MKVRRKSVVIRVKNSSPLDEPCSRAAVVCSHHADTYHAYEPVILALCAGRTAPAELRARLAYDEPTQRSVLEAERPGVGEFAILCTCHPTEAYFTSVG